MTLDEKRGLVREFILSDAEPYVDSIIDYIDRKTEGFEKRWYTVTKEVTLSSLNSDPTVSPLAVLEDTMRALRTEGYTEITTMAMNSIYVKGYELEDDASYRERIKYCVLGCVEINGFSKTATKNKIEELREEIKKLENNLKQLETQVDV
jgi:hypothetical protein